MGSPNNWLDSKGLGQNCPYFGDFWPKAVGLLWACEGAKLDDLKADYWNSLRNFGDAFS
jgi:hypothetical protein